MRYLTCPQCGARECDSSVSEIANYGRCHECQSANVAPKVLRFHGDTEGESVLKYAESLVTARDRNYVRSFDRNADVKLARALLDMQHCDRCGSSTAVCKKLGCVEGRAKLI